MKVIVVGLGSMGRRRIRLIKQHNSEIQIIGIDLNSERRLFVEENFGIETSSTIEDVLKNHAIECAFICTSPLSHSHLIHSCLQNNLHVFTELNLVADGYDENIELAAIKGKTLFLSSTFLYRDEVKKISEIVKAQSKRLNYTYHIGQYLPDWHPWEHYNNFFVGEKRTNGCREIFAIELPWLIEAFGKIKKVTAVKDQITELDIDYYDNYLVMIEHETGNKGVLSVDIISRKAVRNLEIYGEDLYLSWDGTPYGLKLHDLDKKQDQAIQLYDKIDQLSDYSSFIIENAYLSEIALFFEAVSYKKTPQYGFEKDRAVLAWIDVIEA